MSEVKIARFADAEACKSIFSERSTFVLRSPIYYQRMFEASGGDEGDKKEGRPDTANGTSEFTRWVVSCWTILKGNEPTEEEWDIFKKKDRNIVAIISTPNKVCGFLNKNLKGLPFHQVEHRGVEYDKEKVNVDHTNFPSIVPFAKDKQFTKEKEYRFALTYGWGPQLIDSLIFCGGIDYMEKCFANPEMKKEDKGILRLTIDKAMAGYGDFTGKKMGDIIANANILFE
ncbi:MAG: hypothetical protein MUO27_09860 [Sedimentisphaerales bacterium]|nr:hypothetical protein [Sedimentisphaerales bacterium]